MTETNAGETAVETGTTTEATTPQPQLGDEVVRTLEEARQLIEEASKEPEAPKADETSPETPKAERKSRAIAEKAKKDAAFFKEKQEVEAKAKRIASIEDLTARIKAGDADPDDLLNELGIDYRTITESKLKNGKKPPSEAEVLDERVAKLEKELADSRAALKAKEIDAKRTEAVTAVMHGINGAIEAGGDRWDAVRAYAKQDEVMAEMQRSLRETATEWSEDGIPLDGTPLTTEEALDIVEERWAEIARKGHSTKYARPVAGQSSDVAPAGATTGQQAANGTGSRTLTNGHGASGGKAIPADGIPRFDTLEQTRAHMRAMLGADD